MEIFYVTRLCIPCDLLKNVWKTWHFLVIFRESDENYPIIGISLLILPYPYAIIRMIRWPHRSLIAPFRAFDPIIHPLFHTAMKGTTQLCIRRSYGFLPLCWRSFCFLAFPRPRNLLPPSPKRTGWFSRSPIHTPPPSAPANATPSTEPAAPMPTGILTCWVLTPVFSK